MIREEYRFHPLHFQISFRYAVFLHQPFKRGLRGCLFAAHAAICQGLYFFDLFQQFFFAVHCWFFPPSRSISGHQAGT